MAHSVEFPEQTAVLHKPASMTDQECSSLPIMRKDGQCISVWEFGPEELASINLTHKVVIGVCSGETQPPMWVEGAAPALEQANESNLVKHARAEMKAAGLWDEDADYGGMIAESVMQLMQVLSYQGHSGGSHEQTMSLFMKLAHFKNLTPLTNNPDEWSNEFESGLWQNKRCSSAFSNNGGKSYWLLETGKDVLHIAAEYEQAPKTAA